MKRKDEAWYRWMVEENYSFKHFVEYIKIEWKRMKKWRRVVNKRRSK